MRCITSIGVKGVSAGAMECREGGNQRDGQRIMSLPEKEILCKLVRETEPLKYPLRKMEMAFGPDALEYVIPDEDKAAVLEQLYPFVNCPGIDEMRFDIHAAEYFRVSDFKVIREMDRNFLVSPYYASSGGMVVDWLDGDMTEGAAQVMMVRED